MKLCPQCEFLYEDDQIFCDMDGEGLVHDLRAEGLSDVLPAKTSTSQKTSRKRATFVTVVFGLLLSALLSFAYYTSSRPLDSELVSRNRTTETSMSQQSAPAPIENSSMQTDANALESPMGSQAASESAAIVANEPADHTVSEPVRTRTLPKATEDRRRAGVSRLTISRRLPPLPQLIPLPRLPSPRRLAAAKPTPKEPVTTTPEKLVTNQKSGGTSQKALVVEVKPESKKVTKRSRVGTFLKKTGSILKKPFKF